MSLSSIGWMAAAFVAAVALADAPAPSPPAAGGAGYAELVTFFREWREFQKPKVVGGVPDYSPRAMDAQRSELAAWQRRFAAIDPKGWTIPQQVDYHVVRAELNGLDFDHRVLKPWANNPAFYVTVFTEESDQPAREGPFAREKASATVRWNGGSTMRAACSFPSCTSCQTAWSGNTV